MPTGFRFRAAIGGVCVSVALALAGQAVAHTMPRSKGVAAAKRAAARTASETSASSYRVGTCRRPTVHRWLCPVTYRYPKSRKCTAEAVAVYASRTSYRIKSGTTKFVCF